MTGCKRKFSETLIRRKENTMDDNRITYPCPFCGQMVMIKDGGEDPREEAIEACTCFDAQRHVRIKKQKKKTRENIELLIGEKCPDEMMTDIVVLAYNAGDLVCEEYMDKVISRNQKGIVKVNRASKRQQSLEG